MAGGVDLRTIHELGGRKELEMLQKCSHLRPSHKAEAVEKIAVHFTTLFTTLFWGVVGDAQGNYDHCQKHLRPR